MMVEAEIFNLDMHLLINWCYAR